ncbi:hypothetical protein [Flagellimonas sediminis]|mgnify:CR=1 FL=1|uniref:Uncharacterized protein n=1 Tax=Flagellimonas sediminis TaxID=2696468 RepID=A0A6I5KQ90_9FLAO|nr:hypothetical protein [Allomuricauda sediminis]NDV42956.1 hypothetical protein [Allomuricauda sediminis]
MAQIVEDSIHTQQEILVRLERNNTTIQRLFKKLGSYTNEPKCPSDFEKFNALKNSFKIFSRHQKEIMDLIKKQNDGISEALEMEVREQLGRFRKLESDFAAYLLKMGKSF